MDVRPLLALAFACHSSSPDPRLAPDGGDRADGGHPTCAEGVVTGEPVTFAGPRVIVSADETPFAVSPVQLGANVNKWFDDAQGLWDPQRDQPVADAAEKTGRAALGLLRHPGGTSANLFDWKRAVGPARRCQIDGDFVGRPDTSYGPSEFMALVQAVGAEGQIMVPFVSESPADAADWVEYMNAPVGTNPGGGVAWAEVRAADGSPDPYGVTRWEIGNEQDRGGHQAYWMSTASDQERLAQYIGGAEIRFDDQPAARDCDFATTTTSTAPGQRFYLKYGLIAAGTSPTVKVGGVEWTPVADLSTAGPADSVYELDRGDGSFRFGDGEHGAIPPAGREVTVSYSFRHAGFVAMADAMKATAAEIGIDIDVCAAWAPPAARGTELAALGEPSFPAEMARRGLADRYDCVAMHPYTNFGRDFGDPWESPAEGHHEHMLGETWSRTMVDDLIAEVRADSPAGFVTISELGALWFSDDPEDGAGLPAASATMTHALFMASQFIHFARVQVGWVEGNTLVAEPRSIRGVLGGSRTGFVYSAEAMAREALAPLFAAGSLWTRSDVEGQLRVDAGDQGAWPVFQVGATTGPDGALRIVVVNRHMEAAETAEVVPIAFTRGAAIEVTTVAGASFTSYNDGDGPGDDSVAITRSTLEVDSETFTWEFPAASITVFTLRPPC